MSQPTRARTTGGARKPRNASPAANPAESTTPPEITTPDNAVGSLPAAPAASDTGQNPLAPETLAHTLRAVAAELERDPDLARRVAATVAAHSRAGAPAAHPGQSASPSNAVAGASGGRPAATNQDDLPPPSPRLNRTFRPRLVTGASPDLGVGIPDPFALYQKLGAGGLRAALDELRLGTLRAIVREHGLDPKGTLSRQNDAEKLRAAILKAAAHHS